MFLVWENVPTAVIAFTNAGDLSQDVTGTNFLQLDDDPNSEIKNNSAIIYDTNGSVTDVVFGAGASSHILGFAGPQFIASDGISNSITLGRAVLNGKFIDGKANPADVSLEEFKEAFIHEFGHFSGLDHSQINLEVLNSFPCNADDLAGLPLMFPILACQSRVSAGLPQLAPDDIAAISELYPDVSFQSSTGRIQGRILFSDGTTQVQGLNVVARQVDNPATPENESRRIAVSSSSGFRFTMSAGNPLDPFSDFGFGSQDQNLIGLYEIPGLAPGSYTVEVEAIDPQFVGGSGIGPIGGFLGFNFPMPGTCPTEFLNITPPESDTDACTDQSPLVVNPGAVLNVGTDIILNGTPPTFDAWESARLWLPSLWARRAEA
jgi:hypothetical protein